jgi:hypothetical protein
MFFTLVLINRKMKPARNPIQKEKPSKSVSWMDSHMLSDVQNAPTCIAAVDFVLRPGGLQEHGVQSRAARGAGAITDPSYRNSPPVAPQLFVKLVIHPIN